MSRKYTKNPTIAWMADEMDTLEVLLQNWVSYINGGGNKQKELQVVLDSQKFERVEVLCRMFAASAKFRRSGLVRAQNMEVILGGFGAKNNAEKAFRRS